MDNKIRAVEIGVYHHGCFASMTTEKFPNVSMELMSTVNVLRKGNKFSSLKCAVKINSPNPEEMDSFIHALRNFKTVKNLEIWSKGATKAFAFVCTKSLTSTYGEVLNGGGMHIDNTKMEKGYDIHNIITSDYKDLQKILNGLEEIGEVKVTKIRDFNGETNTNTLTEKQLDALRKAISFGYYSWPKKVSLEELAKQSNISRRTYQDHLRKAESKLFPTLVKEHIFAKNSY